MTLAQFFFKWPEIQRHFSSEMTVLGISSDTRVTRPGYIFIALRGQKTDGHQHIPEAIKKGCLALVVEDSTNVPSDYQGFVLQVPDTREVLDILAAHFYANPSTATFNIGVTGTNGKTSTTHMIEKIFNDQDRPCAVIGTIDHHLKDLKFATELTTPGPVELQESLRTFSKHGAQVLAMEVSSHALDQKRVNSVDWNTAVFTNLTQDHLDYHKSMRRYFEAKEKLFREHLARSAKSMLFAVINTDDKWGRRIRIPDRSGLITYGMKNADLTAKVLKMDFAGIEAKLQLIGHPYEAKFPFAGLYNMHNALAAIGSGISAMLAPSVILESLSKFESVPGRLERVLVPEEKYFFVDYAHTPDALQNVLQTLGQIRKQSGLKNKIHVVFGCGGDRDKIKRPLMYQVAENTADFVYLTSDNPRTERPQAIIADILSCKPEDVRNDQWIRENVYVNLGRTDAIRVAAEKSQKGDVIVVAGKGHENYQIFGSERIPFSDREEILKIYR